MVRRASGAIALRATLVLLLLLLLAMLRAAARREEDVLALETTVIVCQKSVSDDGVERRRSEVEDGVTKKWRSRKKLSVCHTQLYCTTKRRSRRNFKFRRLVSISVRLSCVCRLPAGEGRFFTGFPVERHSD